MSPDDADPDGDEDTHEVLMEATYQTLAAEGYDALSLRAVADRADKSRGLVHYHFDSKQDLVLSLLDYLLDRLEADIDSPVWNDPEAALRSILERVGYGPADGDPEAYYRAMFALRGQAPFEPAIRERLTRNYLTLVDRLAALIEAGIQDGTFREVDPKATAAFLIVTVDGARTTELSLDVDDAREDVFAVLEAHVFPSLLASTP